MGEWIKLTSADGFEFSAWKETPEGAPRGAVVVVQEIFGVNHHIRSVAHRLAAAGYLALGIEIFHRTAPAHAVVAWVSAAPTWPWSLSNRLWSEVNVAWRPAMVDGEEEVEDEVVDVEPDVAPVPDAAGVVVAVVAVRVGVVVLVVVVAVWLVSALARVALAEASDAWAEITAALSVARSSDANVWPAATDWPTDTSTALTVPEALKLRSAWLTGVMVPTESSVDSTVPEPTRAVR